MKLQRMVEKKKGGSSLVAVCHVQVPAVQRISQCSDGLGLILHSRLVSAAYSLSGHAFCRGKAKEGDCCCF